MEWRGEGGTEGCTYCLYSNTADDHVTVTPNGLFVNRITTAMIDR